RSASSQPDPHEREAPMRRTNMFVQCFALSSLLFVFANSSRSQPAPEVYTRLDIRTFSKDPSNVEKFCAAVAALQERNLDNATAWFNMAGIHEFGDDETNIPASIKDLFHQCHRRPALFFLWHRAYVFAMERLLQDAIQDPTFRIPYWDWYTDPSIPEIFRSEWLDTAQTKRNPLYVSDRNEGVNGGDPVWNQIGTTNFNNDNFNAFQSQLNGA